MGKRKELEIHLTVEFVPLPPEHEEAWRAGIRLLLELLREEIEREDLNFKSEVEKSNSLNDIN